jgi:hypothetical protein
MMCFVGFHNKIENFHKPVCIQCKHFENPFLQDPKFGKCLKFGKKDLLTGKIEYDYADLVRKYNDKCGVNGTFFEKKKFFFSK